MLSVVLSIIKAIGLILLVLLALVILILLLVLFVPVRYGAAGSYEGTPQAEATVSWFLKAVRFRLAYAGKLTAEAKVLCFRVWSLKQEEEEETETGSMPESQSSPGAQEPPGSHPSSDSQTPPEAKPHAAEVNVVDHVPEGQVLSGTVVQQESGSDVSFTREELKDEFPEAFSDDSAPDDLLQENEKKKRRSPGEIVNAAAEKILSMKGKADDVIGFLKRKSTKRCFLLLKNKLIRVIGDVLPRKLSGNIRFGFDDPFTTGEICSIAAFLLPLYEDRLKIEPLFDRQEIGGQLTLSGRVRVWVILLAAAQIWLNRDFKKVYRAIRNKKITEEDHG